MACFKSPWTGTEALKKHNVEMSLTDVLQHYKKEHGLNIKKVIDLTQGFKFYQRQGLYDHYMLISMGITPPVRMEIGKEANKTDKELIQIGIPLEDLEKHFKLPIKNDLPNQIYLDNFVRILDLIMSEIAEDEIVGMHCFHGINRTGYLVVYYLI